MKILTKKEEEGKLIDNERDFCCHLTPGCFVNQCRRTFNTLIVDAVFTIVNSFAFCSLEAAPNGLPMFVGCGDGELPPE